MNSTHTDSSRQVTLMSLYFGLYFGAAGFIQPFINLHFYAIGLNGVQIGTLSTVGGLLALVAAPLLGAFYDRSSRKRLVFQLLLAASGVFLYLAGWAETFLAVLLLYTLHRFTSAANIPTAENLAYSISHGEGIRQRGGFGFIRQWGSVAFAATALAGGWLLEHLGMQINFLLYLLLMGLVLFTIAGIPAQAFDHTGEAPEAHTSGRTASILKVIVSDRYLLFMVAALALTNPLNNGIRQFEPIYMSQLGLSESLIGLAATLSALGEVPIMLWANRLITRLGLTRVLLFVFAFDLVRRLLVWFHPSATLVFVVMVATCISFALRLIATVSIVNQHVPRAYTTTALALISMTLYGVSNMISSGISGVLFDLYGGRSLYLLSAAGCLVSLLLGLRAAAEERSRVGAAMPPAGPGSA